MANKLVVTGKGSSISLGEKHVTRLLFDSETPQDSNARATDYGLGIKVWGKILFDLAAGGDQTLGLAKWSQVPAESGDSYRLVEAEHISASQVVRKYTLTDAFVVEYSEKMDVETGVGTFYLHVRQKKDENAKVAINGGFGV